MKLPIWGVYFCPLKVFAFAGYFLQEIEKYSMIKRKNMHIKRYDVTISSCIHLFVRIQCQPTLFHENTTLIRIL